MLRIWYMISVKSSLGGGQSAGRVLAARFRLRLSVGLLRSSFTSCSLINEWWTTILGWYAGSEAGIVSKLYSLKRRSSLSSFLCSASMTHVASQSLGEITNTLWNAMRRWVPVRLDCCAPLTGMSLLVFPVCIPSAPWYLFHLHTLLFLIFSSSKVCAPSRAVKRCASFDLCWRASLCAFDC